MSGPAAGESYKVALLKRTANAVRADELKGQWLAASFPIWPAGLQGYFHISAAQKDVPIENAPPALFDAIDEFLFDDKKDAVAFLERMSSRMSGFLPVYISWAAPYSPFQARPILCGRANAAPAGDTVKIITLPVRGDGMAPDAFPHHWLKTLAGLALSGPGTQDRHTRLISTVSDSREFGPLKTAPFNGAGIVQFASRQGFRTEFASDHYHKVLAPDEQRFTDPMRSRAMTVSESIIFRSL